MATITLTIPDPKVQRILDGIAGIYPIPETVPGTPDYTKAEWARLHLKDHLIDVVTAWERREAIRIAGDGVVPDNDLLEVT